MSRMTLFSELSYFYEGEDRHGKEEGNSRKAKRDGADGRINCTEARKTEELKVPPREVRNV